MNFKILLKIRTNLNPWDYIWNMQFWGTSKAENIKRAGAEVNYWVCFLKLEIRSNALCISSSFNWRGWEIKWLFQGIKSNGKNFIDWLLFKYVVQHPETILHFPRWWGNSKFIYKLKLQIKRKISGFLFFDSLCKEKIQFFPIVCFIPVSFIYYSHKTFYFRSLNMWRFFPLTIPCDTRWVSYNLTQF